MIRDAWWQLVPVAKRCLMNIIYRCNMKRFSFFILLMVCLFLLACDKKQAAIDDLENFAVELKENSASYTADDWDDAKAEYELLVEQLEQYDYSEAEQKQIGRLKTRCLKQLGKGAVRQFKDGLRDVTDQIRGAIEEITGVGEAEGHEDVE